ncbi:MAG: DUF2804 domain-containing protein [Bacilli bacterium]|jgi:hypothetical protein|nr:DUF2804 domain-containing protein [Bacilli bacterium]MDY0064601.1 DUF2804 domain-containing protein [Bacilli bacterium]
MQVELTPGPLLDQKGNLVQAGYAKQLVKDYDRRAIKAAKHRIKEWDYYFIGNSKYGIALTIADNSYMGLVSVTFFDFAKRTEHTKTAMTILPMGKLNFPSTSQKGDLFFENKEMKLSFLNDGKTRHLVCQIDHFLNDMKLQCDITLNETLTDTMVIATPFDKPQHFYYNQKINCLLANGNVQIGLENYNFDAATGVLDWGRGVWTYQNTWYWSSLSAIQGKKTIGFNLGYGFGDTSKATENMLYYDKKGYKIDQVWFQIPTNAKHQDDYMQPWHFTSNDQSLDLSFHPLLDRHSNTSLGVISSLQHQVFGLFRGWIRIDNKKIEITDLLGFAEKVKNKW